MLISAFTLHPDGLDNPRRDYLKGRFVVALIAEMFAFCHALVESSASARLPPPERVFLMRRRRAEVIPRVASGTPCSSSESVTSSNMLNICLTSGGKEPHAEL